MIVAMLLIAGATALCLRWMRARVPGVLGGWLAALVAGGVVGLMQAASDSSSTAASSGDIWPLMVAYVAVADGLAFGACVGWIVGLGAVVADRIRAGRSSRPAQLAAAAVVVLAMGVALGLPSTGIASVAASTDAAESLQQRHPRASCAPKDRSSPTATATRCCCAASTSTSSWTSTSRAPMCRRPGR